MAIIKGEGELYEKGIYKPLITEAEALIKVLEMSNALLKEQAKINKDFIDIDPKTISDLNKVQEGIKKTNEAFKAKLAIDDEIILSQKKLSQSRKTQSKDIAALREATNRQNAANRENAKINALQVGSIARTSLELRKNIRRYNELSDSQLNNSKIGGQLKKRIEEQRIALDKLKGAIRSTSNFTERMTSSFTAAGIRLIALTGGAFALFRAFRAGFNSIREFDKEMQNLAGIAGKTRTELKGTEERIIDVAGESIKTSNEVAKLATTLFALGKTDKEVNRLLKPTNNLSIALQATSDESGELLVGLLNAFEKGADSGQKFADTIAKIRTSTSLNFQRIKDSFGFVASTANVLNFTLGKTGALIGVLQDNNVKAARAGRLLNSSFIKLATDGNTLEGALDRINKAQESGASSNRILQIANKDFGKEAAALGIILSKNRKEIARLTNEFDNLSEGSLKKLTDEQLKAMDAELKILDSTWEKFLIRIENGEGVIFDITSGFISFASGILQALTPLEQLSDKLEEQADSLISLTVSLNDVNTNSSTRIKIMDELNSKYPTLLKNLGFNVISEDNLNEAIQAVNKNLLERSLIQKAVEEVNEKSIGTNIILSDRQEFLNKFIFEGTKNLIENGKANLLHNKTIKEQIVIIKENQTTWQNFINDTGFFDNELKKLTVSQRNQNETFEESSKLVLNVLRTRQDLENLTTKELRTVVKSGLIKKTELDLIAREIIILRERKRIVEENIKVNQDEDVDTGNKIKKTRELTGLIELQRKAISDLNEQIQRATSEVELLSLNFEIGFEKEELDRLLRIVTSTREEFEKQQIKLIEDSTERRIALERARSEKLIELIRTNARTTRAEKESLILLEEQRLEDFETNLEIRKGQRALKLDADLAKAEFEQRRSGFKTEAEFEEEKAAQFLAIKKKQIDDELELLRIANREEDQLRIEQLKAQREQLFKFADQRTEDLSDISKAILDKIDESLQARSDKRLEALDEELEASEKQQDRLEKLAEKEVVGADESILAEEKRAAEIKRQKQEEERRQELISAGFKIFSALIEEGKSPGEAVLETSVILGALPAIIEALPTFFEGTENVADSLGKPHLSGRDGYVIRADGTERIVDGANNAKMGGVSNDQAADIVHDYNSGLLGYMIDFNQPKAIEVNTNWSSNEQVLNKFDSMQKAIISTNLRIEKAIENQPVLDDVKFNRILNQITTVMVSKNKIVRTTSKQRSIF